MDEWSALQDTVTWVLLTSYRHGQPVSLEQEVCQLLRSSRPDDPVLRQQDAVSQHAADCGWWSQCWWADDAEICHGGQSAEDEEPGALLCGEPKQLWLVLRWLVSLFARLGCSVADLDTSDRPLDTSSCPIYDDWKEGLTNYTNTVSPATRLNVMHH